MLIEIFDRNKGSSFVIEIARKYEEKFGKVLPFKSVARVWKEEIYFETPLSALEGSEVSKVEKGKVYYWPPGKAICVFYGFSQIYTPGIEVGTLIDPPHRVSSISEGDELEVFKHSYSHDLKDIVESLLKEDFRVSTPLDQGSRIVSAMKIVGGVPIRFSIFVEEYGIHLESESLAIYNPDLVNVTQLNKLRKLLDVTTNIARLDVSEDGHVVITACGKRESVVELANEIVYAVWLAKKNLMY